MVKKTLWLFVLLIFIVGMISAEGIKSEDREMEEIRAITENIISIARELGTYRASEVYKHIKTCLDEVDKLYEFCQRSSNTAEKLERAKETFKKLYNEFYKIDSMSIDIKRNYETFINSLPRLIEKISFIIRNIEYEIDILREKMEDSNDPLEKKYLGSMIFLKKKRIEFLKRIREIILDLPKYGKEIKIYIDEFLKVVHYSAKMYWEAYKTVWEISQLMKVLKEVASIINLGDLSIEMQESWTKIEDIIEQLSNISVDISYYNGDNEINVLEASLFPLTEKIIEFFKKLFSLFFPRRTWADVGKIMDEYQSRFKETIKVISANRKK